jgi:hypothetical protein
VEERKNKEEGSEGSVKRNRKGGVGWRLGERKLRETEGVLNGVLGFRFEDPMWLNSYGQLCNTRILRIFKSTIIISA